MIFPANNIWNTKISNAPVHCGSDAFVSSLGGVSSKLSMWTQIPTTPVPGCQTSVAVSLGLYASESDPGPSPIPPSAVVEKNGDAHVIVVGRDTNKLYELYHAKIQPDGSWVADQQSIWDLTSNVLRPNGWTSADGAGLPIYPGLVRFEEAASGIIPHALRLVVASPLTDGSFVWPARHRQLKISNPSLPPMGQRFRLKASKDISKYATPIRAILQALKDYGAMVSDMGSTAFEVLADTSVGWACVDFSVLNDFTVADFEAVNVSYLMVDPNSGQAYQYA